MRLVSSLKKRIDKIHNSLFMEYWNNYYEWLYNLTEKQSAKYWFYCYDTGHKRGILSPIQELQRDTEEDFDVAFWEEKGQQLFLEAQKSFQEKLFKESNIIKHCPFNQILGDVKLHLEKQFDNEVMEQESR